MSHDNNMKEIMQKVDIQKYGFICLEHVANSLSQLA